MSTGGSGEKTADNITIDDACSLLRRILQVYRQTGPESMEILAETYLSAPPGPGTALDPAAGMIAEAFRVFDGAADSVLKEFASRFGFHLSDSATYQRRRDEGYFGVSYPFLIMYLVWLDRAGEEKVIGNLGDIFASTIFGVAGYVMLDSNLDEQKENPAEILLSLAFIQEHERLILHAFDCTAADYDMLNRFKRLFLSAEIREKHLRFHQSPYTRDHPENCGYKAVHAYLPFGLLLRRIGKEDQIDEYLRFFYEWGAPLQIMDDIIDLEDDIRNGHYSYPTLGFEGEISRLSPGEASATIRSDVEHITQIYTICKRLLESSRQRSVRLGADLLGYFVTVLESRIDTFFLELLKNPGTPE